MQKDRTIASNHDFTSSWVNIIFIWKLKTERQCILFLVSLHKQKKSCNRVFYLLELYVGSTQHLFVVHRDIFYHNLNFLCLQPRKSLMLEPVYISVKRSCHTESTSLLHFTSLETGFLATVLLETVSAFKGKDRQSCHVIKQIQTSGLCAIRHTKN